MAESTSASKNRQIFETWTVIQDIIGPATSGRIQPDVYFGRNIWSTGTDF